MFRLSHHFITQVTLEGIPKKPEELDNYYKTRGPIPQFHSEFGCIQDVVGFKAEDSALGKYIVYCVSYINQDLSLKSFHLKQGVNATKTQEVTGGERE